MKRIHIFTAGGMPLPPVNGGGVENLIQLLIEQNEYSSNEFVVYSIFDEKALKEAPKYKNTIFQYWKMSKLTSLLDCFIWNIFHGILKRETILFRNLLQRLKIILKTHQTIKKLVKKETNAIIVLEHSALLLFALLGIEKNDCKIFFHTHNNVLHEYKKLNKVVKKLDGVISISEYLKRTNAFFLQSCKNQYILKNAINSKLFSTTITDDVRFNDLKQKYNSENKKLFSLQEDYAQKKVF